MSVGTGRWLAVGLAIITSALFFGKVWLHPDHYLFAGWGDGLKNYFTFAWHVKYDQSWLGFGAMNAPYFEHVVFTDGHPLFSLLLGWIPWVQEYPVGTLNLLMMLSFPLSICLMYEALWRYQLAPWIAALAAVCIVWMQPQLFRLEGHFSLSYGFWIPLMLVLISPVHRLRFRLWWLALAMVILAAFLVHPYTAMMMVMWLLLTGGILLCVDSVRKKASWLNAAKFWSAALVPLIAYMLFVAVTDTKTDRTAVTYGFLHYKATYETIVVPHHPPFRHLVSQVIPVRSQEWEGWAYIGLTTLLTALIGGVAWLRSKDFRKMIPAFPLILFFAALPVLCFSFAWPFSWGLESLLDKIPFVRQFRSPGRFAWVFYYASTMMAFVLLSAWSSHRKSMISRLVVVCGALLMVVESVQPLREVKAAISRQPNVFRESFLPKALRGQAAALSTLNDGESAWIPMPFFHFGSDVYSRIPEERYMAWAMLMTWHSGMPMCASSLSRTSMSESMQQLGRFNPKTQSQLSGHGETYLMRPLNEPTLPFDEQNYWSNAKELNQAANIKAVINEQPGPLNLTAVSWPGGSVFSDQWNEIRMTRGNYFVAASCTPDSLVRVQRPVFLELSLTSTEAWKLAFIQLIVQQKVGDELQWKVYQPLSGSSGFTSNGMKDMFPVVLDPSAGQVDVVFHYNGEWPISFRCEEMNWLTADDSD
jgi:hypothetical protein